MNRRDYYEGDNLRIAQRIPTEARRILDVGCATGRLGERLKAGRPDRVVWGIEAVPEVAREASMRLDRVLVGDVESLLPFACLPLFFDCITCGDVLEHLREPGRVLRSLRENLMPNGMLICSVPNVAHWSVLLELLQGRFPYADSGLLDRTHLRFFTPDSFREALHEAGFQVVAEDPGLIADAAVVEALCGTARALGLDPEATRRAVSVYQQIFVARKIGYPVVSDAAARLSRGRRLGPTSVVVLTFNSMPTLPTCLQTLCATVGPEDELIVVDNASTDGTIAYLQSLEGTDPRFRMLYNDRNLGFSAGCNVGLRESVGEFVVLLNPDTVVRPGWLAQMQALFMADDVGAVGPTSINVVGDQYVDNHLPASRQTYASHQELAGVLARLNAGTFVETKLLIGFCLMIRKAVLEKMGLLDEDLFLGNDDLELSWRLRRNGYRLLVARDVYVEHICGVSFASLPPGEKQRLVDESTLALARKLEAFYGSGQVPSSQELWGCNIFDPPTPDTPSS